ncbi:MAG: acyl carrier protein [Spirochaetota bacterium]
MNIEKVVNNVVYDVLKKYNIKRDAIKPESSLIADLGASSLDIIEMLLAFEEKFNFSINEEDIRDIETINDICEFIKNHLKMTSLAVET